MYQPSKLKTKIYSSGVYLPPQVVTSDELFTEIDSERKYGIPIDWMSEKMGIMERRVSESSSKPSDLAIPAARQALDKQDSYTSEDIDLVIFCGIERDVPEPATAHKIQKELGINAKYAFDVANACFGFIDAMQIADCYVSNRIAKAALVVTGEIPTRVLRAAVDMLKRGVDIKTAQQVIGALSVGDAGGAVIIGPCELSDNSGFELFNSNTHTNLLDKCMYKHAEDGSIEGHMAMGHLAGAFIKCHHKLIDDTLDKLGWNEFDWLISHQIGKKPFERLANLKGVTKVKKMTKTLDKLGNITSATFPVNFHKMVEDGVVKSGDKIGGCFAGSGVVIGQFGYRY
jgi:3-oxoacyl-[acyl-carrier-protein] synthase III